MKTFILSLDCETCDTPMHNRVGDLTASPSDEPVINLDMAVSQTEFTCRACGGMTYLGDLDEITHHEPGDTYDDEGDVVDV